MSDSEPTTEHDDEDASVAFALLAAERRADEAGARRLLASLRRRLFDGGAPHALGRYVLGDELGSGGAGVVVRARDPDLGRDVAIKLVHAGSDRGSGEDVATSLRMLREAQVLARVEHVNVVRVFDVGTYERAAGDRSVYFVMELVEGRTLAKWLGTPRSWRAATVAFAQAARGLAAAHAAGIVHRDFKPSNAIIDAAGTVRVLDFGLARGVDFVESATAWDNTPRPFPNTLTATGLVVGTPPYMAPEQHEAGPVDARVDQFALCVSLFEAIFGQRPFPQTDSGSLLAAKRSRNVTIPSTPEIPSGLAEAMLRGLAPDPALRHRDMEALAEALEAVLHPRPRWWTWGLAALTLALGVIGLASGQAQSPTTSCEQDASELRAWDDAAAERLASAFAATGMKHAETATPRVLEGFAAHAAAIDRTWHELCVANDPRLPAQLQCLHARRDEMLVLADGLVEAGPIAVARAVGAVAALTDPATCRDPDEPTDAPADEEHAAVVRELARLGQAFELGRSAEVRAALPALTRRADALGDASLRIKIRILHADTQLDGGDHRIAEAELEAAGLAAAAIGDDARAAEAWFYLAFLLAQNHGRIDDARRMLRHGEAAAAELGEDLARTRDALVARNAIAVAAGDYEGALEAAEQAYALCVDLWGEDDPRLIDSESRVAVALRRLGRTDEAIARLESTVERARKQLGDDHPDLVLLHGNLGIALIDRGDYRRALDQMQRVIDLLDAQGDDHSPRRVLAQTYVAEVQHHLGHDEVAVRLCNDVLAMLARAGEADGPSEGNVRVTMALALTGQGDHLGALAQLQTALDIRMRLDPEGRTIAETHRAVAGALLDVGRIDDAREHARIAVQAATKVFGEDSKEAAESRAMLERAERVVAPP